MSGIGGEANVRTTSQSASCRRNYRHLVFDNSGFRAVGMAIGQRYKKHLTNRSCANFTTLRFVKSPQLKRYVLIARIGSSIKADHLKVPLATRY